MRHVGTRDGVWQNGLRRKGEILEVPDGEQAPKYSRPLKTDEDPQGLKADGHQARMSKEP